MASPPPRPLRSALLAALVFALALGALEAPIAVSPAGDAPPFNPDEAAKLADARFFSLAGRGAWRDPAWSEHFYARTNPAAGKLVFGAALALAGERPDGGLQGRFDALWRAPAELRREVPDAALRAGRRASACFGALACAALALVAASLGGLGAGLAAALLLLGHAVFATVSRRALTDSLLLLWIALAPLVFAAALRALRGAWSGAPGRRPGALLLRAVLAPALVVALAAGTKPNGALLGVAYALALAAAALLPAAGAGAARRLAAAAGVAAAASTLAFGLFVASNPYLWDAPWARLVEGGLAWRDWMVKQQLDPGGALHAAPEKVAFVAHAVLRSGDLALVRAFGAAGRWLGLALLGLGVAALALQIAGAARVAAPALQIARAARGAAPAEAAVSVAAWAGVLAVGIASWIPIVRMQYALPVVLPACALQALGLAAAARAAAGALRGARRGAPPAGEAETLHAGGQAPSTVRRSAAAAAVALAVVALLSPASPLADASLLHPLLVPDSFAKERLAGYRQGVAAHPDSALRRYHLAVAYAARGRFPEAARELEDAIARLPAGAPDAPSPVLRAELLLGLARVEAAAGDAPAAARAFAAWRSAVAQLRDAMLSADPFVRSEFDLLLDSTAAGAGSEATGTRTRGRGRS